MNRPLIIASLALALIAAAMPSSAAIIRVEKDGSGDYITLQEGLDAAQPGDTVRIGPGRYDTFSAVTFQTGTQIHTIAHVSTSNIAIEGTSRDAVRIGPATSVNDIGGVGTLGIGVDVSATDVIIRNITAENSLFSASTLADRTTWESVAVLNGGQTGLQSWATDGLVVRSCFFSGNQHQALWLVAQAPSQNVIVENCTVESNATTAFDIGTAKNVTVRNCTFRGNPVAMQYWNGATGQVEGCTFEDSSVLHLAVLNQADVVLNDSTFSPGARECLHIAGGSVSGTGNYFGGGWQETIEVGGTSGSATFSNCTILNGGQYSVFGNTTNPNLTFIDLRNNFWGTSDPAQIAEWIFDVNDFPQFPDFVPVAFEPFLEQSVATETTTMGSIKALFADPK